MKPCNNHDNCRTPVVAVPVHQKVCAEDSLDYPLSQKMICTHHSFFFGPMQRVFEGRWFYHSIFETQMVHMAGPFTAMLKKKFTITMPIWQGSVELVDNGCKERKSAIQHHHSGRVEWAKRHHSLSPNGTSQVTVFMQTVVATIMHSPQLLFWVPCRECLKVDGSTTRFLKHKWSIWQDPSLLC